MAITKPAAKKAAPVAKKATAISEDSIMAYSMKRKSKVELLEGVLSATGKGSWIAKGVDDEGNKVSAILSETNAKKFVKAGIAKLEKGQKFTS